jgi:hypothetical protein
MVTGPYVLSLMGYHESTHARVRLECPLRQQDLRMKETGNSRTYPVRNEDRRPVNNGWGPAPPPSPKHEAGGDDYSGYTERERQPCG